LDIIFLPTVTGVLTVGVLASAAPMIPSAAASAAATEIVAVTTASEAAFPASTTATKTTLTASTATTETAATTTPISSTEIAATAATLAIFHRTSFIDDDRAGAKRTIVKFLNRGLGFRIRGHFHKTKTLGTARHLIHDYFRAFHSPAGRKEFLQLGIRGLKRQAPHIKSLTHYSSRKV
jgi:hypothetical protein